MGDFEVVNALTIDFGCGVARIHVAIGCVKAAHCFTFQSLIARLFRFTGLGGFSFCHDTQTFHIRRFR